MVMAAGPGTVDRCSLAADCETRHALGNRSAGGIMKRRSVLQAGLVGSVAALLPRFAIGQSANARVLRFVPQANLTVLDPISPPPR